MGRNSVRNMVQIFFLLFYCWVGLQFYRHVAWAMGEAAIYVERPTAVEAFLPIGALVSLKRLMLTGLYDTVHPAALTIFIMALGLALVLRKSFCGYLCPVGAGLSLVEKIGDHFGITRRLPRWASLLLYVPKYLLLAVIMYVLAQMGTREMEAFIGTQYWRVSDTRMLLFFLDPSVTTLVVVGVILLGNMLIKGFWCQGLCPYGALMGLLSWISPVAVRRDKTKCVTCGKCARACPSRIRVDTKDSVRATACVACGECVSACPVDGCLSFTVGYGSKRRSLAPWTIPAATLFVVFMVWVWAANAGYWYTPVDKDQIREDHAVVRQLAHY